MSKPVVTQEDVENVQKGLAAAKIEGSELTKLQEKQRAAVDRAVRSGSIRGARGERVHPDLQDLNFGELGEDKRCSNLPSVFSPITECERNRGLQPPLRPNASRTSSGEDELGRGTLSDYSDYGSSDEDTHNKNAQNGASSSKNPGPRAYPGASDLDVSVKKGLLDDDPFADPFGDSHGV